MRVAQGLYERGYITYMRTDSTTLSADALAAARAQIESLFGARVPARRTAQLHEEGKNAQEAHEAIRPAGDALRTPDQLSGELGGDDLRLYELIWQRTLASQMADATGRTVVGHASRRPRRPERRPTWFARRARRSRSPATGASTASVTTTPRPTAAATASRGGAAARWRWATALPPPALEPKGHTTQPPARYTEASLVKALEENGIGRPSTYASIMQTIQDHYVWKKGQALVPTPTRSP